MNGWYVCLSESSVYLYLQPDVLKKPVITELEGDLFNGQSNDMI